jgi:hypothetical protein
LVGTVTLGEPGDRDQQGSGDATATQRRQNVQEIDMHGRAVHRQDRRET